MTLEHALRPGGVPRQTAGCDIQLKDVAFEKPQRLTAPGAGGAPIQYWLIKPPNFDPSKKYLVVCLIHGGPQGNWGDGWSYRWKKRC